MQRDEIISWLLTGDVAIQYQTHRDLLPSDPEVLACLKQRIALEGWGHELLQRQNSEGYWGRGFYQPKWTNTHYSLLDLRHLCTPITPGISKALDLIIAHNKGPDGGINPSRFIPKSDVCVNGMFLNYACYFGIEAESIRSVVDFTISQQVADGAFNCNLNRFGAQHSSMHSTISVLEGIREYVIQGYSYRREEFLIIESQAREFLLQHHLFRSDKTGEIINPGMLRLVYPSRWKYDILRALEYFRRAQVPYDERMFAALEVVWKKRTKDGRWKAAAHYPGAVHFDMEPAGKISRWNTLRAMRVLDYYKYDI